MNETIVDKIPLDFETVSNIMQEPIILIVIGVIWLLPIIIYIIIASITHARTSSGKKLETLMIQSPNAWIPVILWGFFQLALFLGLIFPLWLKWV